MRHARLSGLFAGTAVGVMLVASSAWACIAGPTLNVSPAQARPGQEVTLSGLSYNGDLPIVVRFNGLDGPVLGTFDPVEGRFGDKEALVAKVSLPADVKPGNYVFIATQSRPDGTLAQVPVRALVTVTSSGGVPVVGAPVAPPELGRPVGPVITRSAASTGSLILVGAGAAGVAMFAVGLALVVPGRKRTVPEVARVAR